MPTLLLYFPSRKAFHPFFSAPPGHHTCGAFLRLARNGATRQTKYIIPFAKTLAKYGRVFAGEKIDYP